MINWLDFICDNKPAILKAVKQGSGIYKGETYQCWEVERGMYRIWNSRGNAVLAAKGYFIVVDGGDVLN